MFLRWRGQSWRAWADNLVDELLQRSHFCTQDVDYTLTSTTAAQRIFDGSNHEGALYLTEGRYRFYVWARLSGMSATSGNAAFSLGGTATINGVRGRLIGGDATSIITTVGNISGQFFEGSTTEASAVTATTGTGMVLEATGIFNVAAAGTVQPQMALVTAAAATVVAGSWCEFSRIADRGILTIGDWR